MKKKLLFLVLAVFAFTTISSAQTKIWNFGNDTTTWPLSSGIGTEEMVIDFLGLFPIPTNTNFGAITANSYTFVADGFSSVNRFQLNGGGSAAAGTFLPVQRYLYFTASGACTVKVWFRTGGSGSRNMFITDGTNLIATAGSSTSGDGIILTASVSAAQAAAGKIYIYADQSCNLYKLEVSGATVNTTLGVNDYTQVSTNIHSYGKDVYVSNVLTATEIKVYSITGALVKSFNAIADSNFQLNQTGLYIVNVTTEEGSKSVKVAIN
jgi:hypothetical protein